MTILITGGAGYVGSHTAYQVIASGYDVVVIDNLETGFQNALPENVRFYSGDIRDRALLDMIFEREDIQGVLHFAAYSQVGESMAFPLKYYNNNLSGTRILLECMLAHQVNNIVFSSSAAVYGEPKRLPIFEDAPLNPTSCYGETKLSMEKMIKWVSAAHGLHFVSLRYFNACGAKNDASIGESHCPETHLIPLILEVANGQRTHITVYGNDYPTYDGTCVRDYIHVCDLAQAHILALEYLLNGGANTVFNLGCGNGYSVKEVIQEARNITGHPIPAIVQNRRLGDPAVLIASSEKAASVLGWHPEQSDLNTIISSAWKWHQSHPNGFTRC